MDINLNVLESKVLEAVELIQELRGENRKLTCRNGELEGRNGELEGRNQELEGLAESLKDENTRMRNELDEARQQADSVEVFEQKRKEIEDKVGGLLEKLEALG
jgi:FtsZ-binding cell division protein ZapB